MRNFINDIRSLKEFCDKNSINFNYNSDTDYKYTLLYDSNKTGILEIILVKKVKVIINNFSKYFSLHPHNVILYIKVNEGDDRLNLIELIIHKFDTHHIDI
jgi:hypothetical protein